MKKFAILTSLLALTACGGGSGGGSSAPVVPENPDIVAPGENNGGTTQPDNGGTTPENPDTPSGGETETPEFPAPSVEDFPEIGIPQELGKAASNAIVTAFSEDVDLTKVDFGYGIGNILELDDQGRINAVNIYGGEYLRNGDTNEFATYEYELEVGDMLYELYFSDADKNLSPEQVKEKFTQVLQNMYGGSPFLGSDAEFDEYLATVPEEYRQDYVQIRQEVLTAKSKIENITSVNDYDVDYEQISVVSHARDLNLRFADFGIITHDDWNSTTGKFDNKHPETTYSVIVGDNKINLYDNNTIVAKDMTFSGRAAGVVWKEVNDRYADIMEVHGDANLTLDTDKNSELTMDFDNWYTVTVDQPFGRESATHLSGDEKVAAGFAKPDTANISGGVNIQYLGADGNISEAAGEGYVSAVDYETSVGVGAEYSFGAKAK